MDIISALEGLAPELEKGLEKASTADELESLRVKFLGRKGELASIMSELPSLAPEKRPEAGKVANRVKEELTTLFEARKKTLEDLAEQAFIESFDPTLPGRHPWEGTRHPITLTMEKICSVFEKLGFDIESGPEVETDYYNFEALNLPPEHPARDMQDTLYITDNIVLRTQTSAVQVHTMERRRPPLAVVSPGKVYRRDSDITHTPMFHQVEGLMVGDNVTLAHLRGVLTAFSQAMFGKETKVRFRPSFFPFTEPSAEVDISCCLCHGKGHVNGTPCRVCKTTGWLEILGCGMVDPAVFSCVGYPEDITGFAFGMGVERIAMLTYGLGDLRMFFENDARFLRQFV
ncbi:phenylalanine--tRNA ligase subunit alpha [Desulfovibrio sp. An276]|uniref:phenylalanine--tRNA ligase subunit alpha n=1 Tax=Desulfovibrio sp. An276 TaxID=1965618 RepID=UPI000B368DA2|nr:phenylalanine--tRNA ligase subunit alpha [Desulfovibrio sp. An276]OUO55364.1 phenylalanine--tRNA ligase subunit alpha [Desulfovibrio sp. An276]